MLENLLNWAKTQQGSFPFTLKWLPLNDLISREIEHIKPVADQKHIALSSNVEGEIMIEVDENMLVTVIRNLISNAIKFTHPKGSIVVEASETTDFVNIVISDTGIGMNDTILSNLFTIDKGYTSAGNQNERGSGLGLIICKEFVERHGGTISVQSEPGKGSQFHISLPHKNREAR